MFGDYFPYLNKMHTTPVGQVLLLILAAALLLAVWTRYYGDPRG